MDRLAIQHQTAANPGADGEVSEASVYRSGGRMFGQSCRVDISVEPHRHTQLSGEIACDVAICPTRLGGGGNEAPAGRGAIQFNRAEATDAKRGDPAPPSEPFRHLGQRRRRVAGRDGVARDYPVRRRANRNHELGAARLDRAQHQATCSAAWTVARSPSSASRSKGAGTPPKLPSGSTSTKLQTVNEASTNQL